MEQIEKATGKQIVRVETGDLDVMEEVCSCVTLECSLSLFMNSLANLSIANEESIEVVVPDSLRYSRFPENHPLHFRLPVATCNSAPSTLMHPVSDTSRLDYPGDTFRVRLRRAHVLCLCRVVVGLPISQATRDGRPAQLVASQWRDRDALGTLYGPLLPSRRVALCSPQCAL